MSQQTEPGFGSDSFLDIIANIVGILIILIVIAGVRVSQAPLVETIPEALTPAEKDTAPLLPSEPSLPTFPVIAETVGTLLPRTVEDSIKPSSPILSQESELSIARTDHLTKDVLAVLPPRRNHPNPNGKNEYFSTLPETPPQPVPQISRELQNQVEEIKQKVETLANQYQQGQDQQQTLVQQYQRLQSQVSQAQTALQEQSAALQQRTAQLQEMQTQVNTAQEELLALERQVHVLEDSPLTENQLEHRITPVSQTVTGKEVHFQMVKNQIAVVPLEPLLEELKVKVKKDIRWLAKYPRHQGEIGPVQGYSMMYVVERKSLSLADQLNYSPGMMRIEVAEWQLHPQSSLTWETVQRAVTPGSKFHNSLGTLPPGTTLTFWVYPDSFAAFRQLQAYAHSRGFQVAGRPLPEGMPISGSPNGSHSAGQ